MNRIRIPRSEVYLLTGSLLDPACLPHKKIGGLETYTYALARALRDASFSIAILQQSPAPFVCELDIGVTVYGSNYESIKGLMNSYTDSVSVLLDHSFVHTAIPRTDIFVQHGVYWDGFVRKFQNPFLHAVHVWEQRYLRSRSFRVLKRIVRESHRIITVDTNFQNWYRGMWPWDAIDTKCVYVPNFASLVPEEKISIKWRESRRLRIVFARRFTRARGTLLWANAVALLLKEFPDVEFLMAGDGPDMKAMKAICPPSDRVTYRKFSHEELLKELQYCHISVVPTLFCEGTSLSLLESMAAGCTCVATPIGGICDLIRNEDNGLLVAPDSESIRVGVRRLILDSALRERLAKKAMDIIQTNHSETMWASRMIEIIGQSSHGKTH